MCCQIAQCSPCASVLLLRQLLVALEEIEGSRLGSVVVGVVKVRVDEGERLDLLVKRCHLVVGD